MNAPNAQPGTSGQSSPTPQMSSGAQSRETAMFGDMIEDMLAPKSSDTGEPPAQGAAEPPTPDTPEPPTPDTPEPPATDAPEPVDQDSPVPSDVLAAAGAAEPPEDTDNDDDEDADDAIPQEVLTDAKARHAWQKKTRERREARAEVKRLRAEVERLTKNQTPDLEEVQALRNKAQEYEAKLGQYDLAATQAFKEQFDAPLASALQQGVSVLVRSGKSPEEARELMTKLADTKTQAEAEELLADESFAVQGALVTTVAEYAAAKERRQEALQHWEETRAATEVQDKRAKEVTLMENIERDTEAAVQQAVKEGNWMFARSTENQEWNEGVDARIKAVKGLMRSAKPEELVKFVVEGLTARPLRELFAQTQARANKLAQENQRLQQVSPRLRGSTEDATPVPEDKSKPMDPSTLLESMFPGRSNVVDNMAR